LTGGALGSWLRRQGGHRDLDDPGAVVLAVAAVGGALVAVAVPVVLAVVAAVVALRSRRPAALWVAAFVLTSALAAQAWAGLVPPDPAAPFTGTVHLAGDPERAFGAWRVEVVQGDRRLELWARGAAGALLSERAAGQFVDVVGRVEPVEGAPWLAVRHVAGRLVVDRLEGWRDGGAVPRAANAVRDLLRRGAEPLPEDLRALFLGFVLGDDRGQDPAIADDFEAAGLTHLMVVSGSNVAFLLTVSGPLLRRCGLRARFAATVALLVFFATITRFEPSVLRATAMAGLAALGATLGRPGTGLRMLALAVAGLVVADPFLVHAIGFRLSVAASAGILLLARPLADALPGPRVVVLPLAVTLAAQAGVAPVLVPTFGPMPVAAIPANLLAEPVAGLVMMWGCSAGLVAGVLGGPVAAVLHWPTSIGLGWVAGVARRAAELPLGGIGLPGVLAAAGLLGATVVWRSQARAHLAVASGVCAAAVLLAPAAAGVAAEPPQGRTEAGGAEVWRGPTEHGGLTVVVLPGDADPESLLRWLRSAGVDRLDLVIARSGGPRTAAALDVLDDRLQVQQVWAPRGHQLTGAVVPAPGTTAAGGLSVEVRATAPRLDVAVTAAR
jgi:competence protein ComEC